MVRTEIIARTRFHSKPASICHAPTALPARAASINETFKNRIIIAKPAAFEATERNAVMVIGAPSYTSGVQKWKGTAEILYPKPAIIRTPAIRSAAGLLI